MGFSRKQQAEYRRLESAAWRLHCSRRGVDPKDKAARQQWYRGELKTATGSESTRDCDGGRDYESACAHFEGLADDGIRHQLRLIQGDLNRVRHAARQINPAWLDQFAADADLERYLLAIARQAFGSDLALHELTKAQIRVITQAVRIDANRALRP